MDTDRDGQIGMYEWNPKAYDRFLAMDTDNDGFLIPRELGPSPKELLSRHKAQQVETAKKLFSGRARIAFKHADRDGDGTLNEVEWRDARLAKHVAYTPPFPVTSDKFLAAYMASNPHE